MAERNDQVFQLSLTEIAFTIAFILLLLLGYLVFREQTAKMAAQAALAKVINTQQATHALEVAKKELTTVLLGSGAANPDAIISRLVAAEDVRADRDQLRQKVQDLDAKLTALTELREKLEKAAKANHPDITKQEVDTALALQDQVRKAFDQESMVGQVPPDTNNGGAGVVTEPSGKAKDLAKEPPRVKEQTPTDALTRVKQAIATTGELKRQLKKQMDKDIPLGHETQTVQDVVTAAKGFSDMVGSNFNPEIIKKENSDLRGQVAFLKNKLDARGGRDYPPCWADQSGKVEFLFSIETKPNQILVAPSAWSEARALDARTLPGISEVLSGSPHSNDEFVKRILGIFDWSKKQNPECRHYVQLKSSIADAVQSDRVRLLIENYFYKLELRR